MGTELFNKYIVDRYVTKQKFRYIMVDPHLVSSGWDHILNERKKRAIKLNLVDEHKENWWYVQTPSIEQLLDMIEKAASKEIQNVVQHVTDWDEKVIELLIDEAYYSSVIEGAVSTRKRAGDMIKNHLKPRDYSEQMIMNNHNAMDYIINNLDKPISEEIFLKLHKIITDGTLEKENITEKYRDDWVGVQDLSTGETVYSAPKYTEVQWMMDNLFEFANSDTPEINPIIKASIIHFYIVYVHPFFDGNGRTSRAFMVFYLLKQKCYFFRYLSISKAIKDKKVQYYKSILDCEENATDVTYFIENQLYLMGHRATELLKDLVMEISVKTFNKWLEVNALYLSERQIRQLKSLWRSDKKIITIKDYIKKAKVSYETARSDLNELYVLDILERIKVKKQFVYRLNAEEITKRFAKEIELSCTVSNE